MQQGGISSGSALFVRLLGYQQSLGTEIHHFNEILTGTKVQNEKFHASCMNMYGIIHLNGKGY